MTRNLISLKKVYYLRQSIKEGRSVADLAKETGIAPSVIYSYTKAERAQLKKSGVAK